MVDWKKEFNKCNGNKFCLSEVDAKARGNWFFKMDVFSNGGTNKGAFEVFAFAPNFPELDSDQGIDINESEPPELFGVLNRIHHGEAMAFIKMQDSFSAQLSNALATKGGRDFDIFRFTLKRFSRMAVCCMNSASI